MSLAQIGHGTLFQKGNGASPEVFTSIAEVTEVSPPQVQTDLVDATHYSSPGGFEETINGLKRLPEFTANMNFLPEDATQDFETGLIKEQIDGTTKNYRIVLPNAKQTSITFAAIVRGVAPAIPIGDKMTLPVTFKPTGAPTWAHLNP